ncbi:hypothetical protein PWT90_09044 [Aphanocladium album]|nr:hypothetical protein PWT90_09044 [Aphanocladium album]
MVFLKTPNITPGTVSDEAKAIFGSRTAPLWCRQLLADSSLRPVKFGWRTRDRKISSEDSYLSSTLNSPDTIAAVHLLHRASPAAGTPEDSTGDRSRMGGELLCLFALGSGVNGHTDVANGGLTASIFDVCMGSLCAIHSSEGDSTFTIELSVRYKKPLVTPGIYVCRVWLEQRTTGRKAWVQAVIEDGNGTVFAEGNSFWLDVPRQSKI